MARSALQQQRFSIDIVGIRPGDELQRRLRVAGEYAVQGPFKRHRSRRLYRPDFASTEVDAGISRDNNIFSRRNLVLPPLLSRR